MDILIRSRITWAWLRLITTIHFNCKIHSLCFTSRWQQQVLASATILSCIGKNIECVNTTSETEGETSPTYVQLLHLQYFFTLLFKIHFSKGRTPSHVEDNLHVVLCCLRWWTANCYPSEIHLGGFGVSVSMLPTTVLLMYIYTACWLNNYVVQLCPFWCNSYGARLSRLLTVSNGRMLVFYWWFWICKACWKCRQIGNTFVLVFVSLGSVSSLSELTNVLKETHFSTTCANFRKTKNHSVRLLKGPWAKHAYLTSFAFQ